VRWIDPRALDRPRSLVRSLMPNHADGYSPSTPAAAFLAVRWGGPLDTVEENWGAANSSVSGTYAEGLFGAIHGLFGESYSVTTRRVSCSADLRQLTDDVHSGKLQLPKAPITAALYFLWPTTFYDGASACSSSSGGFVEEGAFFDLLRAVEGRGVPTRFPHPSHVYRLLLSKEWQASLCTAPQFCLPPTTRLPISAVVRDAAMAAGAALRTLASMDGGEGRGGGGGEAAAPIPAGGRIERPTLGVAKLGFSWEGLDVRAFKDQAELAAALTALTEQEGFFGDTVIVQSYVPACCELRLFVVDGVVRKHYFCRYEVINERGIFGGWKHRSRADAASAWCGGDEAALEDAVARATALAAVWTRWLVSVCAEPVPVVRMDVLVSLTGAAGKARVTSLELTEAGMSMFAMDTDIVFDALARSCV